MRNETVGEGGVPRNAEAKPAGSKTNTSGMLSMDNESLTKHPQPHIPALNCVRGPHPQLP